MQVDLTRVGTCAVCGASVAAHFDAMNRKISCEAVKRLTEPINEGRLFGLKVKRNAEARKQAQETIRQRPDGQWQAKVGGAQRGWMVVGAKRSVEAAIERHYNDALYSFVTRRRS